VGLKQQLTEPWGIAAAALLGGMSGAVTAIASPIALLGIPVGLVVAGGVYVVKVGGAVLVERGREPAPPDTGLPAPRRGSVADGWLRRAQAALGVLQQQAAAPADPVLREQVSDVDERAEAVVADMYRLGGQVTVVERSMNQVDPAALQRRLDDLREEARTSTGALHDEKGRAVRAVADQIDVYERLAGVRRDQLARMESATLGLEGLAAKLAELLAMHASTDLPGSALPGGGALPGAASSAEAGVAELTDELDGLRAGLAETEALSRQVLAAGLPAREDGATPATGPRAPGPQ
jgi:hypothetical protein